MAPAASTTLRLFSEAHSVSRPEAIAAEAVDRLYHREAFRKRPRNSPTAPFSREWFEEISNLRYSRQGNWLPRVLEFVRHRGDTVLGLGEGLGTDWLQYAMNGAEVVTLSPSHEQLDLIRTHFDLRGQAARHIHGSPQCMPLPSDSVDVVCVQGLLDEVDDAAPVVRELYRVLRPGGKVIVVAAARYNASYWYNASYPWLRWLGKAKAHLRGTTGKQLRTTFSEFAEHRVSKRHLRRSEMPHLWRGLPLSIAERLVGNRLVMKAFKPLSAALSGRQAA
jgi:ubiquinone/menaquinone biosynthesis C-methylase UbiE